MFTEKYSLRRHFWLFETGHSHGYEITLAPSKDSDQPAHPLGNKTFKMSYVPRENRSGSSCDSWISTEHTAVDAHLFWVYVVRAYAIVGFTMPQLNVLLYRILLMHVLEYTCYSSTEQYQSFRCRWNHSNNIRKVDETCIYLRFKPIKVLGWNPHLQY